MGTDNNWRFSHHFSHGFEVGTAMQIGQNLVKSLLRFSVNEPRIESRVRNVASQFFLLNDKAVEAVVNEIVQDERNQFAVWEAPDGFLPSLALSDWSATALVVAFFAKKGESILNRWDCELYVHNSLEYEFNDPQRKELFRPPKGIPCPSPILSKEHFSSLREWAIYSEMLRVLPAQSERLHGPGFR